MTPIRDTFLHYLADNLPSLTIHPLRADPNDPTAGIFAMNAVNIRFGQCIDLHAARKHRHLLRQRTRCRECDELGLDRAGRCVFLPPLRLYGPRTPRTAQHKQHLLGCTRGEVPQRAQRLLFTLHLLPQVTGPSGLTQFLSRSFLANGYYY
jgi:hypothetical protein